MTITFGVVAVAIRQQRLVLTVIEACRNRTVIAAKFDKKTYLPPILRIF